VRRQRAREGDGFEDGQPGFVIERIARQSTCEPGAAAVRGLVPRLADREWAHDEQTLVGDALAFLQRGGVFGFSGVIDIEPMLANASKGASLSAVQLRSIAGAETALRSVGTLTG